MAVLVEDTFTEGSNTPLQSHVPSPTGTAWAEAEDTSGTTDIQVGSVAGAIFSTANFTGRILDTCTPVPTSADVDVEIELVALETAAARPWFLIARFQNTSNYYIAASYAAGDATDKKIVKCVAGVRTLIASGDFGGVATDVFKFELRGSTLKFYKNGSEMLSVVDTAITAAGNAGVGLGNATDVAGDEARTGWQLDDFKLTEVAPAPPPPGGRLFSDAFRAEAGKQGHAVPEIYLVLELGAPFNLKLGTHGVSSTARGGVDPRIEMWGILRRGVDPLSHALTDVEFSPTLIDEDRVFARLFTKYRSSGRRATAVLRAISPNVPDADSFVLMSGILHNAVPARAFAWTLTIRPDDGALRNGKTPKLSISAYFPGAHDDVKSYFAQVLYGRFSSNGAGNKGFVPLYLVDQTASKYLVGQGTCNALTDVYDPETDEVIGSTLYAVTRPVVNGAQFTLATFTPARTEPILYADAEGLTVNPDGTGGLITNPADQFLHAARNFIWGDYRSGAYLTASPANADAIDVVADYFTAMDEEGSFWFGGETQRTGMDVVNSFLESTGVYAFWSNGGEVIVKALDHRPPADVYDGPWIEGDTDEVGAFGAPSDPGVIERGVTVSYTPDPAHGGYKNTLRVADKSVTEDVVGTLQLPWSASRVV